MFGELVATGRHKDDRTAREYGGIITRESERLSHLIDNVLDFARLERGKASYNFSEGDLAEVVERALDVCRYRLDKEKMKLETIFEPELPGLRMDEQWHDAGDAQPGRQRHQARRRRGQGVGNSAASAGFRGAGRARLRARRAPRRTQPDLRSASIDRKRRESATCAAAASAYPWSGTSWRPTAAAWW